MFPPLRCRILGALDVTVGTTSIRIGGSRQQRALAVLLLDAGTVVPIGRLAATVWDDSPPATATQQLHSAMSALRRQFRLAGSTRQVITTDRGGYRITLLPDELDAAAFTAEVAAARTARRAGRLDVAAAGLRAAVELWRGPALDGLDGHLLQARANRLDELRRTVIEEWVAAELSIGAHHRLVPELTALVAAHPARERLVGHLMTALHRSGRQVEALEAYRRLQAHLTAEFALAPGAEIRRLQAMILRDELGPGAGLPAEGPVVPPGPGVPQQRGPESPASGPVVAQLPVGGAYFTGRAAELDRLDSLLSAGPRDPAQMVITGTAGVGKTALAIEWAHRVADRFPDGQLYVDLRGYDPGRPVTPGDALAGFLRALGVPGPLVPVETDERAATYRSLTADRRMLVVLDNAGSTEHVRSLLPGSSRCVVVVTSRDSLPGLVARHGARRIELDLLSTAEALDLLRVLIPDRVAAEPDAAALLVERCARLPLALRIAAELAASRTAPLRELADELADEQRRLDVLDAGSDDWTGVRAVFSWSYRRLPGSAAAVFRMLGLHPGPHIGAQAAAALAGIPLPEARRALDQLHRANLVGRAGRDHHTLHDLLRSYAVDLARTEDIGSDQEMVADRPDGHHLAAVAADRELDAASAGATPRSLVPGRRCAERSGDRVVIRTSIANGGRG